MYIVHKIDHKTNIRGQSKLPTFIDYFPFTSVLTGNNKIGPDISSYQGTKSACNIPEIVMTTHKNRKRIHRAVFNGHKVTIIVLNTINPTILKN